MKALSGTLSPPSPAAAEQAEGADTEQGEAGGFGNGRKFLGCHKEGTGVVKIGPRGPLIAKSIGKAEVEMGSSRWHKELLQGSTAVACQTIADKELLVKEWMEFCETGCYVASRAIVRER